MKKFLVLFLSLMMLLACTVPAMAEEPVTITVCIGWGEASLPNWEKLADEFEAANPGIKIDLLWSASDMTKLQAQFMSGDAPDICQTWKYAFNEFVDAGLVLDLTDMFAGNGWTDDKIYKGVKQWVAPLSEITKEDCRVFGVPDFINTSVIYYNTDIFAKYGIEEPTDTASLIAASKTLIDNGIAPMVYCGGVTNIVDIMAKIICQTTPLETLMAIYNGEDTYLNDSLVKAGEVFQQLVDGGVFDPKFLTYDDDQAYSAFANGEAAMYVMHTGYNTNLMGVAAENNDFHYSIMKGIQFVDEPVTMFSATYGANWVIPTCCKHPEEAKKVLSYFFGIDSATEAARDYGRITMFPEANKEITAESTKVIIDNQMDLLSVDSFYLIDMVPSSVLDAMAAGMQEIIMGNMDVRGMLEYTQEAMDILISER
jgi:ABC-type glycerol-3-phosphate transport system substrate-binding protein